MVENKLYPLTHPQQRIWYTEKLHPGTSMWNNAGTLKITGSLDLTLMTKSINLFIKNNEAMRIRITEVDGKPFQYVCPFAYQSFDYLDFSGKGLQGLYEWDSAQTQSYLPLLDKQLFYIAIASLGENEFVWYAKVHHIISDAWSLVMFSNQVMEYYVAFIAGGEPEAVSGGSYTGFIERENEYMLSRRFEQDKQSFNDIFKDIPEPTVLKQKKTNYTSTRARRKACIIPKTVADRMRVYCTEKNVSVFPLFLATLCIYINRILNKDDIVIGVPVFNRSKQERNTVGMFVSTVPIRIRVPEESTFDEFARMVSNEWFRVLKHQRYPYELLLADLRKKHKGLESLYDITLSYQNVQFEKDTKNITYEGRWHFSGNQVNSLSIHINDREGEGSLILDYDHLVPFFSIKEIEYVHSHCMNILTDAISNPAKRLFELDVMSPEELNRVMVEFNANKEDYPLDRGLNALFSRQMKKTPDDIALIAGTDVLTYRQLDALVNKAARFLKERGVGREDIVGIVITRDVSLIVFILAVIRAGAAFLPIDPEFPCERVVFELKESRAKCVVASPCLIDKCGVLCDIISTDILDELPEHIPSLPSNNHMRDLAYVIYTSGSTGTPKGVMVEQRSLVHYILAVLDIMDFSSESVVLSATTVSFDIFIMETFPTLINGGTVVLAGENEHNIPRNLVELMVRTRVTSVLTTPSRMQLILTDKGADECLKNIREIMLGGDVLQRSLLSLLQEKTQARLLHFYGPTEITIGATYKDVTESGTVNIGKPLPDTFAYILDKHKNPVPIGVHGELYIGGIGVARGYLNRPDLTAVSFIDNPFRPGERMYKTGDITRWFPMGEIEFLGRVDQQVKIRGFRIELGEIEARLLKISGITDCAVVDRMDDDGRKYLCAYICGDRNKSIARIRAKLLRELPAYMMPSYFIWMDALPLNVSGKVDKKRLPEPALDDPQTVRDDFEPLSTDTQKALAEIWKDVLKILRISGTDNFFDIGGDSLLIVMVSAEVYKRFQVEVSLEEVYREPTLENYARLIDEEMKKTDSRPILPVHGQRDYPVSAAQRQIFIVSGGFLAQTTAYNIAGAYHIKGKLDVPALERALIKLIAKNESLRTCFQMKKGELRQRIVKKAGFLLQIEDCNKNDVPRRLRSLVRPFDLASPPLFRAALLRTGTDEYVLFMDVHHIVADGTSGEIILSQLSRLYMGKNFAPGILNYKDYSVWQAEHLASEQAAAQREYWMDRLKGDLPTLNLHTDFPRTAAPVLEGGRLHFSIPRDMTMKLRTFAQRSGTTMFMLLLCLYTVFLSKYTGQKDIIVGVPASVRNRHELMDIIGMFINTLPMRSNINGNEKFTELLEKVRAGCIEAFQNQTYPFESVVSDLKLERDPSRNPIFGTMLSYNTFDLSSIDLKDLKTKVTLVSQPVSKFDLTFEIYDKSTTLACEFEYAAALFKKETVQNMAQHFKNMVSEILESPDVLVGKIGLLSLREKETILYGFNNNSKPLQNTSPVRLFKQSVAQYPGKTAVICNGRELTYAQLDRLSNGYAARLAGLGVGRDDIVGICAEKSVDLMASILGTLKAGAAFLPVDPFYPRDRREFMLKDSGTRALITDNPNGQDFAGNTVIMGEAGQENQEIQAPASRPEDLAYVIYTSGSTGKPKGVMLTVRGVVNLYEMIRQERLYGKNSVVVTTASISFDMFVSDALMPLFYGSAVLLCTEDESRQPRLLARVMSEAGVNSMQATPSRMQMMMEDRAFREAMADLRLVINGGEAFPPGHLKKMKKLTRARILNIYGPTETTIYSSIKDLTHTNKVTIGRAAAGLQYYILDEDMNPVPIGVPGELYIGGDSVARGYINRHELTHKHFLKNPFADGVIYRTGDICAFLPNGEVVSLGRSDFQVKIRGLRIELGEIEAEIARQKNVGGVLVLALGEGADKYLCAYYTQTGGVDEEDLREALRKALPVYMIPSYFISLDAFPTTSAGKINRNALPDPRSAVLQRKKAALDNKRGLTPTQKRMAGVWKQVLKVPDVGPEDNFFHLGGDSLAVIQVQTAILKYGFEIGTQDFYELQTLRFICDHIDNKIRLKEKNASKIEKFAIEQKNVPVPYSDADFPPADLGCVLLTGANGYLGAHILSQLVSLYNSRVYCIIRANTDEKAREKLRIPLEFYFGPDEAGKIIKNVHIVRGDITSAGLGLNGSSRDEVSRNVKTVIHSAALTSHYGMSQAFEKANVFGTENVAAFCMKEKMQLLHISTMSVSGVRVPGDPASVFDFNESSYYIGQEYLDNEYRKSKFLAEAAVLMARRAGLPVRIFRVGNLTARLDGTFQMTPKSNAFAGRIVSLFRVGAVPLELADWQMEFSPVELCAKAMLLLSQGGEKKPFAYHLFNPNTIAFKTFTEMVGDAVPTPDFIDTDEFERLVVSYSRKDKGKMLSGIINDIVKRDAAQANIRISSGITQTELQEAGFKWPVLDASYMVRYLNRIYKP